MSQTDSRRSFLPTVLAAAVALTALNALKPLTIDDPSYYLHVQQVASHPLDPYGGELFFREVLGPAFHDVAPPGLVYWLALGARVTGDRPPILKLWLLPFAVLLTGACYALLCRFSRGLEKPGVWLVALSPAVLPSLNLMLDVPALALSLAATALFLRAVDRDSLPLALAAGGIAGLAIETKYTGFTVLAVLVAVGWLRGRLRLAALACAAAVALFVGWEAWVQARYGESQFLYFLGRRERGETGPASILDLVRPLVRTLGPLASPLVPLGLLGLGAGRRWVIGSILAVVAAHLAFALTPDPWIAAIARPTGDRLINLYNLTLGWLGPGLVLVGAAVLWRVVVRRRSLGSPPSTRRPAPRWRRDFGARFLAGWLAIEGLAYLGISTFPAARRVLGVFVVLVLITCRLASRAGRLDPSRRRLVPWVAALGVSLGLLYFAVDLDDAWAERATALRVKERVAAAGGGAIWYLATNWGGFQCYAPRAGLRPVMPDRSWLSRGDWLVIPWNIQVRNRLTLADSCVMPVAALPWGRLLPLSTRDAFYHGTRPIRRVDPSWRSAVLYRVVEEGRLVGTQEHPHQR